MPTRLFNPTAEDLEHLRKLYRMQNSVWIWLGLAAILAFVSTVLPHDGTSAVEDQLNGPLDEIWAGFWALGGILIIRGIWSLRPRYEVVGHLFFTVGVTIDLFAIVLLRGVSPGFFTILGVGLASTLRMWFIYTVVMRR